MALGAQQLARLVSATANSFGFFSRNDGDVSVGRDEGLDAALRADVVEVLEWVTEQGQTRAVIHDRNKLAHQRGEKPTLFVSKDDGGRINGWYVGEIRSDYTGAIAKPWAIPAEIEIVYQYGYDAGTTNVNSQRTFDQNVRDVEKAFLAVKEIGGCQVRGLRQGDRGFGPAGDSVAHYYTGFIQVILCNL